MECIAPKRIEEVSPGDRVLEPVYSKRGELLLEAGNEIGIDGLLRLIREGVMRLQVLSRDDDYVDLVPENVVDRCVTCGTGLALRPPSADTECRPYKCNECGDVYFAVFDKACTGFHCGQERLFCSREGCAHMCEKLLHSGCTPLLTEQVYICKTLQPDFSPPYLGPERRNSRRHLLNADVSLIPLDSSFRVLGRAFPALTKDVSFSGVGLQLDQPVEAEAYVIDFSPEKVSGLRVVARVVWKSSSGEGASVGAAFCGRVDSQVGSLAMLGR